ncbi:hypothetical protein CGC21_23905 [Leishmania donovani]|uniref:Uncharacterized protein n=1 Tax=Leishmania donovani TaxID=5661 RepID=A0A504XEB4_LEIDO|nr:hypothetical protein CGC21_23905 [Leishmania donovani]
MRSGSGDTNIKRLRVTIDGGCLWTGAGVSKIELNKAIAKYGFAFDPDPTLTYGITGEKVISLLVLTAQENFFQKNQVVLKSSAGHERTQLHLNSEGKLGIAFAACLCPFSTTEYNAGYAATFELAEDDAKAAATLKHATSVHEYSTVLMTLISNYSGLLDAKKDYKGAESILKAGQGGG